MSTTAVQIPEQFRSLAAAVKSEGWVIDTKNHLRWVAPWGAVVRSSSTPSDHRARHKLARDLKRAGALVEG